MSRSESSRLTIGLKSPEVDLDCVVAKVNGRTSETKAFSNKSIFTFCPQELILKIVEIALTADHHGKEWLHGVININLTKKDSKTQKPNVAVALLRTSRMMYHLARPILLKVNTLRFCGSGSDISKVLRPTRLQSCLVEVCSLDTLPVLDHVVLYLGTSQRKRDKTRGVKMIAHNLKKATSRAKIRIRHLTLVWELPCWTLYFQPSHFAQGLTNLEVKESLTLTGPAFSSVQEEGLQCIPKELKMLPWPRNFQKHLIQYIADRNRSVDDSSWDMYFFLRYEAECRALAAHGAKLKAIRLAGVRCVMPQI